METPRRSHQLRTSLRAKARAAAATRKLIAVRFRGVYFMTGLGRVLP